MDLWTVLFLIGMGVLLGIGLLTALPDRMTGYLTRQDYTGVWMVVLSLVILGGWFVWPLLPVISDAVAVLWEGSSWTQLVALIAGLVVLAIGLLALGLAIWKHRRRQLARQQRSAP